MKPIGKALCGKIGDRCLEGVVLLTDGGPSVDDEEGVAIRVIANGLIARVPPLLPQSQQRLQLDDRPPDQLDVTSGRHRSDVRQGGQRRQHSAPEVQAVELHVARVVCLAESQHQGLQRRRLTRPRTTDDRDIPGGTGELDRQEVTTLFVRAVHQPDRHRQRCIGSEV